MRILLFIFFTLINIKANSQQLSLNENCISADSILTNFFKNNLKKSENIYIILDSVIFKNKSNYNLVSVSKISTIEMIKMKGKSYVIKLSYSKWVPID